MPFMQGRMLASARIRPRVDAIIDPYKVHGSRMK